MEDFGEYKLDLSDVPGFTIDAIYSTDVGDRCMLIDCLYRRVVETERELNEVMQENAESVWGLVLDRDHMVHQVERANAVLEIYRLERILRRRLRQLLELNAVYESHSTGDSDLD